MGFEARLPSAARSALFRQSFCMKNHGKVHVGVHSPSMAHCNRRGAAPRAPIPAKIGSLDAPENYPHFAAPPARVRARRAARSSMAQPCRCVGGAMLRPDADALPCPTNPSVVRGAPRLSVGPPSAPLTQRRCSAPQAGPPVASLRAGCPRPPPRTVPKEHAVRGIRYPMSFFIKIRSGRYLHKNSSPTIHHLP